MSDDQITNFKAIETITAERYRWLPIFLVREMRRLQRIADYTQPNGDTAMHRIAPMHRIAVSPPPPPQPGEEINDYITRVGGEPDLEAIANAAEDPAGFLTALEENAAGESETDESAIGDNAAEETEAAHAPESDVDDEEDDDLPHVDDEPISKAIADKAKDPPWLLTDESTVGGNTKTAGAPESDVDKTDNPDLPDTSALSTPPPYPEPYVIDDPPSHAPDPKRLRGKAAIAKARSDSTHSDE